MAKFNPRKLNPLNFKPLKMALFDSALSQLTTKGIELYQQREDMSNIEKEQKTLWDRAKFIEKHAKKAYRKGKITYEKMIEEFNHVDQIIAKINVLEKEKERQKREAELHEQQLDAGLNDMP